MPLAHGEHGLDELVGLIAAIRDQTSENPRDVGALLALMFEALGTDPELGPGWRRSTRTCAPTSPARSHGIADGSVRADVDPAAGAVLVVAALRFRLPVAARPRRDRARAGVRRTDRVGPRPLRGRRRAHGECGAMTGTSVPLRGPGRSVA
ncbi:MAG: hypothetical protein R2697_15365 [Ilumatobacteraceae bacterium]